MRRRWMWVAMLCLGCSAPSNPDTDLSPPIVMADTSPDQPAWVIEEVVSTLEWELRLGDAAPEDVSMRLGPERLDVTAGGQAAASFLRETGEHVTSLVWTSLEVPLRAGTMLGDVVTGPGYLAVAGQTRDGAWAVYELTTTAQPLFGEPIIVFLPDEQILGLHRTQTEIWALTQTPQGPKFYTKAPLHLNIDAKDFSEVAWSGTTTPRGLTRGPEALYGWEEDGEGFALTRWRGGGTGEVLRRTTEAPGEVHASRGYVAWREGGRVRVVEDCAGCFAEPGQGWEVPAGATLEGVGEVGETLVVTPEFVGYGAGEAMEWRARPTPHEVRVWDGALYWVAEDRRVVRARWE